MNEKVIALLKSLAEKECASDDPEFSAYDYSGGNFDDAYGVGVEDGRIELAKEILSIL